MPEQPEYGIDELAQRAGTTVRNVRLYQEKGLLPRPRRDGRAAFYNDHHLTRLQLVLRLIDRGYSLASIKELGDAWDAQRDLGEVLGLDDALARPIVKETPAPITADELLERFPITEPDEAAMLLRRAIDLEILAPDGDAFVVTSPILLDIGARVVHDGVPLEVILDVLADLRIATKNLADSFVSMFIDHMWTPYAEAGEPAEEAQAMAEAIDNHRALAQEAVEAALAHALQKRTDQALMTWVRQPPPEGG